MPARRPELPKGMTPRGLDREEAAAYIGISTGLFDALVREGKAPKPLELHGRRVWDCRAIDRIVFGDAPDNRPADEPNEWDSAA